MGHFLVFIQPLKLKGNLLVSWISGCVGSWDRHLNVQLKFEPLIQKDKTKKQCFYFLHVFAKVGDFRKAFFVFDQRLRRHAQLLSSEKRSGPQLPRALEGTEVSWALSIIPFSIKPRRARNSGHAKRIDL